MKKCIAFLLLFTLLLEIPTDFSALSVSRADDAPVIAISDDMLTYDNFLEQHAQNARPDVSIEVDISKYTIEDGEVEVKTDYLEGDFPFSIEASEGSSITFEAEVEIAGLYSIRLDYVAEYNRGADIERDILINGEYQHSETKNVVLNRLYQNKENEIGLTDASGNDIRPSQIEVKKWQSSYIKNFDGYYGRALLFYFSKGSNTVTFVSKSEPITIGAITICNLEDLQSYTEYSASYSKNNYKLAQEEPIILQGETAKYKSDPILYPMSDRTGPTVEPYEVGKEKLNSIGGSKWQEPRQFLVWEFNVEKTGLYTIVLKSRQNISRGVTSNRAVYIDGEILFNELENFEFQYNRKWQLVTLGDGKTAYQIYLTEGKHEIKLEVTLGRMADKIREVEEIVQELNSIYTTIMIITGSSPDTMRDYALDELVPDEIERLGILADRLQAVKDWFLEYTGEKGSSDATLNTVIMQLEKLSADPEEIPKGFSYFKTNIGSLSTWVTTIKQQPLEIDYIALCSEENPELTDPNASFFEQLAFGINQFLLSFVNDYATIGSQTGNYQGNSVKVWLSTGRDQAQILRKLIDTNFAPKYNIGVELELVTAGTLLPATVAGIGPDVALNMADTEPVNYALRDAVIDLKQFSDYEEVAARFLSERMVPLCFDGKAYALPETQTFSVLFYREDVLEDLGIEVPQTWEDVIAIIPILQNNNMSFAIPVSSTTTPQEGVKSFYTLLFQRDGRIYNDDGATSALDSKVSLNAFREWTNYFVNYELPQEYNFVNRFRTGEYPLIVGDFSNFNTLAVSAPEIRGLWSFSLIPGTKDENGNINRSVPISGTNCFILKNAKNYDLSWEFIKWWTDAQTQVDYAKEMESVLGASARHPTANLEALEQIPWSKDFYEVLKEQMKWGKGIPQVPGAYFVARHLDNAFRKVVISEQDVRETLFDYVYTINQEISGKRKEFGLD